MVRKRLAVGVILAAAILCPRAQAREIRQDLSFAASRTTLNLPAINERRFFPEGSPAQVGFEFVLSPGQVAADLSGKAVLDDASGLMRVEGERGRLDVNFGLRAGTRFRLLTDTPFGQINIDEPIPFAPNIDFAIDQGKEFSSLPLPGAPDQPVEVEVLKSFSEDLISVNLVDYLITAFTGLPNVGSIAGVHGDLGINLSDTLSASLSGEYVAFDTARIAVHGGTVAAPGFDRTAVMYGTSATYEERLEFRYSWDFTGYVEAALKPIGIRIWDKRWDLVHTSIPIIPNPLLPDASPTVDLPFQAADLVFPLEPPPTGVASVDRPRVEFGTVAAGNPRPERVRISNTGSRDFRVTDISPGLTNEAFTISGLVPGTTVPADDSITFTVTFTPVMSGLSTASFSLNTDIPGAEPLPLNVSGLAGVTREQLMVSVDRGTVPIDDVSTVTVTAKVTDASGAPKRNVVVLFGMTGGGISPVFDKTDANGMAHTTYMPSESGPHQVTAETSLSGPVSAPVTNESVANAYSIALNKVLLQPGDPCVWEILARLTWRGSGAEVENGEITITSTRGTFSSTDTSSVTLGIMDGELAGVAILSLPEGAPVTVTANLETSAATVDVPGTCSVPDIEPLRTEFVGEGTQDYEPEIGWAPDGSMLVTRENNFVHVYSRSNWTEIARINPSFAGAAQAVAFSPDGTLLAVTTSNGWILVYQTSDWARIVEVQDEGAVYAAWHDSLAWSGDSTRVALTRDDDLVRVRDARTGVAVRDLSINTERGRAFILDWSHAAHRESLLAVATTHGHVQIYDSSYRLVADNRTELEVYGMRWSHDGSRLAVVGGGNRRGTVNSVVLRADGSEEVAFTVGTNPNTESSSVDWSPDDTRLVIANEGEGSYLVSAAGTTLYRLTGAPARAVDWYPVTWHPDNPDVIAAALDSRVHLYSLGEFLSPTMRIVTPSEARAVEDAFTITWEDWDPDSDARISLSAQPASGPAISIAKDLSEDEDGAEDSHEWSLATTAGILPGVPYHIVAEVNDGLHDPITVTSSGTVTMDDPPSVTVIDPPRGPAGTQVTITGDGFRSGATVMFDSAEVTASSVTDTQIAATVPSGITGSVPVVVKNPGGLVTATSLVYEVGAPVRIRREPGTLSAADMLTITVSGPSEMTVTADVSTLETTGPPSVPLLEGPSGTYVATLTVLGPVGVHTIPIVAVNAGVESEASTTIELVDDDAPNLTLSLGEDTTDPGGVAELEVALTDADGLAAFDFDVGFDTTLLEYVSVTTADGLLDRWIVEGRATPSGASIGGFALDAVADPSHAGGTLVHINLRASSQAQVGTTVDVEWGADTRLYDARNGPVAATLSNGLVRIGGGDGALGDVNCDDRVTALDARMCLQVAVGLRPVGLCDDWSRVCDVNLDGRITALDARMILQTAVGLIDLPAAPSAAVAPTVAQPKLWWETRQSDAGITAHLVGQGVVATDLALRLPDTPLRIDDSDGLSARNFESGLLRLAWADTSDGSTPRRLIAVSAEPGLPSLRSISGARVKAAELTAYAVDGREVRVSLPDLPVESLVRPNTTRLLTNYPNPFNPETWIPFQLAATGHVQVDIYDQGGRALRHMELGLLPSGSYLSRGRAARWDGRNGRGEIVASGTYYVVLTTPDGIHTRRLVVRK